MERPWWHSCGAGRGEEGGTELACVAERRVAVGWWPWSPGQVSSSSLSRTRVAEGGGQWPGRGGAEGPRERLREDRRDGRAGCFQGRSRGR